MNFETVLRAYRKSVIVVLVMPFRDPEFPNKARQERRLRERLLKMHEQLELEAGEAGGYLKASEKLVEEAETEIAGLQADKARLVDLATVQGENIERMVKTIAEFNQERFRLLVQMQDLKAEIANLKERLSVSMPNPQALAKAYEDAVGEPHE